MKLIDETCPLCRVARRDTPLIIGTKTVMVGCDKCMDRVRRLILEEFVEED